MDPGAGQTQLSVVIPVYNEEKNIARAVGKISAFCSLKAISWELIIVNDGSRDKTSEALDAVLREKGPLPVRVLNEERNHGKGFAARQGMLLACGRHVLLTDTDLSAPIKEVDKLIEALEQGAQVAIGSRALRKKDCDVRQSFKRTVSGRVFNFFVQALALPGIHDSQCGFKCFTREAAQKLFREQKLDGFSFDVEVLYLARKAGYKIAEVPVMWAQGPDSRVSLLRDSARMLSDLFKIKRSHTSS